MSDPVTGVPSRGLGRNLTTYGDPEFALFLRRVFAQSMGYSLDMLDRPIVGIATSVSDFNNCHRDMPKLVEAVKRGVLAAGGLPMEFPTISLGEAFLSPTSMLYRNLMAMDVEELIRAQPMDSVVLLGGCDKTVPAQVMGAISAGMPFVELVVGPMRVDRFQGERLAACTDCRRYWAASRSDTVTPARLETITSSLATTGGTCGVMGTASTMACLMEALGLSLPGSATIPNGHAARLRAGEEAGRLAVSLASDEGSSTPPIDERSIRNALVILLALGGSTNALIHLTAIAGRAGLRIDPELVNELSDQVPVLVDVKPSGVNYAEDFHAAGGVPALIRVLGDLFDIDAPTVTGRTWREHLEELDDWRDEKIVRSRDTPVSESGGLLVLRGSLSPDGAVLKRSAASPSLLEARGRAVVFDSIEDMERRIDDPELDVRADDVLVLRNSGPRASGMPEAGLIPIPRKLARQGVTDMVRISDGRMSGTGYGTIILHVTPEAAAGGPLALVRDGDQIQLSVSAKSLDLLVPEDELARRREEVPAAPILGQRGYRKLFVDEVLQADRGCDFEFCLPAPAATS